MEEISLKLTTHLLWRRSQASQRGWRFTVFTPKPSRLFTWCEVADQEGYAKQYLPTAQKTLKDHGGVYVAAGGLTVLYQKVAS